MKKSRELGMQTFDQALFDLYEAGKISYEDALRNADSVNDLRLQIKLHGKESKTAISPPASATSTSFGGKLAPALAVGCGLDFCAPRRSAA